MTKSASLPTAMVPLRGKRPKSFAARVLAAFLATFLAGVSWMLTGDFGSRNIFELRAGLTDGGYADRPLRPALARWAVRAPAARSR